MDRRQFNYLIRQLENDAHLDEHGYRRRVLGLSLLGYLYVFGSITLAAMIAVGTTWYVSAHPRHAALLWFVVVPMIVLLFFIVRALWVRFDPPQGRRVTRAQAPGLFELIDRVRAQLKGPAIHEVLIDADFNASIVQNPRLGILGWYRNYLVLGLPYLMVLQPGHVAAVIAHEYGHLSGAHGKFAAWIYRQRAIWGQLIHRLQRQRHWTTGWFGAFFEWYAPYFHAYSFVLARANEYQPDRASADVVEPTGCSGRSPAR
jgi:Zn-dependent protease with chaperone function